MTLTSFNYAQMRRGAMAALAGAVLLAMPATALAQDADKDQDKVQAQQPQAQPPQAQQTPQPQQRKEPNQYSLGKDYAWFKLCNTNPNSNKEQCLTSAELRDQDSQQLLASVSLLEQEGGGRMVLLGAPIGVLLPPGVELQIDEAEPKKVDYTLCQPNNCVAQVELTDQLINSMKAGKELKLYVRNPRKERVRFTLTLNGFTKAHEGEPMTREQYEERIAQLDNKIRDFVEKRREQLEAQQQGEGDGGEEEKAQ